MFRKIRPFIIIVAAVDVEGKVNALVGRAVILLYDKSTVIDVTDEILNVPDGILVILLFINIMLT